MIKVTAATRVINDREYLDIEFTPEQLQAGAEAQYGEGFNLDYLEDNVAHGMFWRSVADQLILDANAGNHPAVGFRFAR